MDEPKAGQSGLQHKEWWVYAIFAVGVFFSCLFLNYIVKKINEAQLEARLVTLQLKNPVGQVTQVQETALSMKTPIAKVPQGNLITIKPSAVQETDTRLDNTKGKEIVILSESLEEPSVLLETIYRPSDINNVTEVNRTEVIELADVAESAQLSEKSESEVFVSTLNEPSSNIGQIVLINDVLQKDLILSIVDENKALTIESGTMEVRPQNCSKLILPDPKNISEVHEVESGKAKVNASNTLLGSQRSKIDDLPVKASNICIHTENEGEK